MNRKILLNLLLSVAVLFGMVVVVQAESRGVHENEIIVGTHTDLSGALASWGIEVTQALRMRYNEANEAGGIYGRKIRLIAEDSQYRVPLAVQKTNKLINRDKIFFMIGALGTPHNNAAFKIMEKENVPNLFPATAARSMAEPLHRLKFQYLATYYGNMRAAVKYFIEEKGKKRPGLIYVDTDFGQETVAAVHDQLKVHNVELVAETTHEATETNFVSAITKLKKAQCDVIFMGTVVRDTIIAATTAAKLGWKVDMVGQTAACHDVIPLKGGKAVEGLYAVTSIPMIYEDHADETIKTFIVNFKKKYGKEPSSGAVLGYVAAELTVIALEKVGRNLTVDSFVKAMESIKGYQHPLGGPVINFSSNNHLGSKESVLLRIQDGKWLPPSGKKMVVGY